MYLPSADLDQIQAGKETEYKQLAELAKRFETDIDNLIEKALKLKQPQLHTFEEAKSAIVEQIAPFMGGWEAATTNAKPFKHTFE